MSEYEHAACAVLFSFFFIFAFFDFRLISIFNPFQQFGQPNAASSPNGSGYHNNYSLNGSNNLTGQTNGSGGYNSNSLTRNGGAAGLSYAGQLSPSQQQQQSGLELDDRGRSKKRNFFGTLKKRLSRSKTRTLSADQPNNNHKSQSANTTTATTTTTTGLTRTNQGTLNGESSRSLSVDRATLSKSNSLGNYPSTRTTTHTFPVQRHHTHTRIHLTLFF